MAIYERRPTLVSASSSQKRRTQSVQRAADRYSTKVFTDLSVTGVTTAAPKDVFTNAVELLLVEAGILEVYATFEGTIGAGNTMTLNCRVNTTNRAFCTWTGAVTSQRRYTTPADLDGTTATRGGFQARFDDLSPGYQTLNFRFTVSGGTGSAANGRIAYRIIS